MSVMQDLYHSEINVSISTFWDAGYDVKLGDAMNGFVEETNLPLWGMVEPCLIGAAIRAYPQSLFAQMYRDNKSVFLTTADRFYRDNRVVSTK